MSCPFPFKDQTCETVVREGVDKWRKREMRLEIHKKKFQLITSDCELNAFAPVHFVR